MSTPQYRWKRRIVQLGTLLLIALIPAFGLFRIDLTTASFTILDKQILWSNFAFVFGLAIVIATIPILIYVTLGTAWCGWACPQNLLSEWATNLTHKMLGKRVSVDVGAENSKVAAAKNKAINWIMLALAFLGASLVLALIPFLLFFSFAEVWSFFTSGAGFGLSQFMRRLYIFAVLLIFIDIAIVRYFLCDYACLYRIGQKIFKNKDALHVRYDATRSADCSKCNYCSTMCITHIQPTQINVYDTCIDCGECIDACNRLHEKSGTKGLLSFELGSKGGESSFRAKFGMVFSKLNLLIGVIFLIGVAMMMWGIYTQQYLPAPVSAAEQQKAFTIARVCNAQCAAEQLSCKGGNIAGCYRAAACKCACNLQQDPDSLSATQWRQCVQKNNANALNLESAAGKTGIR